MHDGLDLVDQRLREGFAVEPGQADDNRPITSSRSAKISRDHKHKRQPQHLLGVGAGSFLGGIIFEWQLDVMKDLDALGQDFEQDSCTSMPVDEHVGRRQKQERAEEDLLHVGAQFRY